MRAELAAETFFDDAFAALAHPYRRRLLFALFDATTRTNDPTVAYDTIPEFAVAPAPLQLRHNHLPKLQSDGFVDWRPDDGRIAPGPRWPDVEPLLSALRAHRSDLPSSFAPSDDANC